MNKKIKTQTKKQTLMYKQSKKNKKKTGEQTSKWNDTIYFEKWEI